MYLQKSRRILLIKQPTRRDRLGSGTRSRVPSDATSKQKLEIYTMGTITLKNTWKNLTLVAAGALMATLIAVPLAGSTIAKASAASFTYTVDSDNGTTLTFELVEREGDMIPVLVRAVYPDSG